MLKIFKMRDAKQTVVLTVLPAIRRIIYTAWSCMTKLTAAVESAEQNDSTSENERSRVVTIFNKT